MGEKGLEDRLPTTEAPAVDTPSPSGTTPTGDDAEHSAEHTGEEIPHGGEKGRVMS